MSELVRIERLSKSFGRHRVLHDFDLVIESGRVYGLLGLNGEGKTTLARILMGVIPADAGERLIYKGRKISFLDSAYKREFGYVPEDPFFYEGMTVRGLLEFNARFYPRWDGKRAAADLERFALDPKARIRTLSRGMKLKLELAVALAAAPEFLILDDPTSGLDVPDAPGLPPGHHPRAGGLRHDHPLRHPPRPRARAHRRAAPHPSRRPPHPGRGFREGQGAIPDESRRHLRERRVQGLAERGRQRCSEHCSSRNGKRRRSSSSSGWESSIVFFLVHLAFSRKEGPPGVADLRRAPSLFPLFGAHPRVGRVRDGIPGRRLGLSFFPARQQGRRLAGEIRFAPEHALGALARLSGVVVSCFPACARPRPASKSSLASRSKQDSCSGAFCQSVFLLTVAFSLSILHEKQLNILFLSLILGWGSRRGLDCLEHRPAGTCLDHSRESPDDASSSAKSSSPWPLWEPPC